MSDHAVTVDTCTHQEILRRLREMEVEKDILKGILESKHGPIMPDNRFISIASSDLSHQTDRRITKPPNYLERDSDEDDASDAAASQPKASCKQRHEEKVSNDSTEGEEADGGGEDDDESRGKTSREYKDARPGNEDVAWVEPKVTDAEGTADGPVKTPGKEGKNAVNEEVDDQSENSRNACPNGQVSVKTVVKSLAADSWILLNSDGETDEDVVTDGRGDEDIIELVDNVESYVEETSKGISGAFDKLVSSLRTLLPVVLVMADEHKMLKEKGKDLILHNHQLQKEVRHAKESLEGNQSEKVSIGITAAIPSGSTSPMASKETTNDPCDPPGETSGGTKPSDEEYEAVKRELMKLRYQIKELQRVNCSWEKYSRKKSSRHDAAMKESAARLAESEKRCAELQRRLEDKFKEYDQILLNSSEIVKQQKAATAEYKRERDNLRQKYDVSKSYLKEMLKDIQGKDDEIKQLNETVQRNAVPNVEKEMKKGELPPSQETNNDDYINLTERTRERVEKQRAAYANVAAGSASTAAAATGRYRERHPEKPREKQGRDSSSSPPLSPRGPPVQRAPMSLTREELKDQVLLYREQMDAFRSDFLQERRDRENAVGQVDSLKKELERTKAKLKDIHARRRQRQHDVYQAMQERGQIPLLPEEIQEMRLWEIKQQERGRRNYSAHGRKYAENTVHLPEEHIYAQLD